jgi:adenine-specific DNA-methyltransferase
MDEMIAAFNNLGMVKVSSLGEINRYTQQKT